MICIKMALDSITRMGSVDAKSPLATSDPIAAWNAEHASFMRLLDLMRGQLDVLHSGGRASYQLMFDIVSYLRDYTDRYHHPREDVAFTRLATRRPEVTYELARLEQEHRVIAHAGEMLLKLLGQVLDGSIVSPADLEAATATYVAYYRAHIREEMEVVALAAEVMTEKDWMAVNSAIPPPARDPLLGPAPDERYRELSRLIALEA